MKQSSLIAKNSDIVVFCDIAENDDNISPFSAIFHLPFYFGGYQGVLGRPESATPEFDKRQYFETFLLVF